MNRKLPVRVRLAPSPTGEVHIGTIWMALFNWLFAQGQHGSFILRVEDTDRQRLVEGSVDRILEALEWYGIHPDEGPIQGGAYGPYIQSERQELYTKHAEQLIASGHAYYCFCTPDRLAELRASQQEKKLPPRYDKHCATLKTEESRQRVSGGESHVIRLRMPTSGSITHTDIIRGTVTFQYAEIDDSVLLKSDGFPTYHLAVVVDDHLMQISHVIRAEEWLPSVPKHLYLYQAFGWEPPQFAHLPLILGSDGSKLSKRHGATSALWFRENGYLPEAMINFLGLMGWHPKGESETLTQAELIKQFKLEEVNPAGAKFDQAKLDWLNGWYIRSLSLDTLYQRIQPFWHRPESSPGEEFETQALQLVQERLVRLTEVDALLNFVFPDVWQQGMNTLDPKLLVPKKETARETIERLNWAVGKLGQSPTWSSSALKKFIIEEIAQAGYSNLQVLWPLRVALTTLKASPDVFDVAALLGKEETLRRAQAAAKKLQ